MNMYELPHDIKEKIHWVESNGTIEYIEPPMGEPIHRMVWVPHHDIFQWYESVGGDYCECCDELYIMIKDDLFDECTPYDEFD